MLREMLESPITEPLLVEDLQQCDDHLPDLAKREFFDTALITPSNLQMISDAVAPGPPEDVASMSGSVVLRCYDFLTLNNFKWLNDHASVIAELVI